MQALTRSASLRSTASKLARWIAAVAITFALVASGATAAAATTPVTLGSSHVLDPSGVLGSKTSSVEAAVSSLYKKTGLDLYVVYVDDFTNPTSAEDWANTTAEQNNLGPKDYLLAIATHGRAFYLSADSSGPLSNDKISGIEQNNIEPPLHNNDWAGAAIGAANGIESASSGASGGGWGFFWIILIVIVVIALIVFFVVRGREKSTKQTADGAADPLAGLSIKDLERQAGSALVQTDDAIKTSGDELGFATAQYGADAAAPFTTALETASAQLKQAFGLKQKLDDSVPDTDGETRAWNVQIIQLCEQANAGLDEQAKAFDELRDLGKNAPSALKALKADAGVTQARVQTAQDTLARLGAKYAPESMATAHDDPAQARERLTFAEAAAADAQAKLDAGDTGHAAVGIRAAEEAVDQAGLLLDAVDRIETDLAKATDAIAPMIADLTGDVAEAKTDAAAGTQGAEQIAAATQQTLDQVNADLAAGKTNPLAIMQRLQAANEHIDTVLTGVRDAQEQARRAEASLQSTLLTATSQVSAAEDFITARRGAVGAEARTRLAEAGRLVVQAQTTAATDSTGALAQAQRANQLAAEAIQLAQNDVGGFGGGTGGGLFGGGNSGGGNGAMGAILGGILINSVLGGGNSRGGLFGGGGGARRGSSSRSRSGGGGFGSAGSFGGGGTRSRRGGGRF